jgi:hypothetical protein
MENKWQILVSQVGAEVRSDLVPCSNREIADFEEGFKVALPLEFKSFCKTFGAVFFGNEVHISCPNTNYNLERWRQFFRDVLLPQRETFSEWEFHRQEAYEKICDLVEYAYFFGQTSVGLYFCFDLRTYDITDESYDIYIISMVRDFGIECLGRNFFDFIRDYCLGTKLYDSSLPEDMVLIDPYELVIERE